MFMSTEKICMCSQLYTMVLICYNFTINKNCEGGLYGVYF